VLSCRGSVEDRLQQSDRLRTAAHRGGCKQPDLNRATLPALDKPGSRLERFAVASFAGGGCPRITVRSVTDVAEALRTVLAQLASRFADRCSRPRAEASGPWPRAALVLLRTASCS